MKENTKIANHEIWETCPVCKMMFDLRADSFCPFCQEPLKST